MQSKTTLKRIAGLFQRSLAVLALFCFFTGRINAQVYVNGNLSTGATASTGETAPAGSTWSEVQLGNQNAGFAANITAGYSVADDFTVTCAAWDITKFTCYSYSTGYTGTTSPVVDLRMQIFDTDPSVGTPTPVYGDFTTNRLSGSTFADMYRIFNGAAATDRKIWKNEANITGLSLPPGHYWIQWAVDVQAGLTSNFSPASTVVGTTTQAGNNAIQYDLSITSWAPILDGPGADEPQDMPFRIDYNSAACAGTPNPGAIVAANDSVCPSTPFTLSPENITCGTGVTYQWQSSATGAAGSFTDITGATNATLTTSLTALTYYQLVVTCSATGQTGTTTPMGIDLLLASQCVCIPATSDCTDGDVITNVTINQLNNTSTCSPNGYFNYGADATIPVPDVVQGIANPISVTAGGGQFDEVVAVWIDYDHSGNFDASEYSPIGGTVGGTLNANINVPATALSGNTRMRVRVQFLNDFLPTDACTAAFLGFGETEDYFVNIVPCVQGVFDNQPTSISAACGGSATFTVTTTGTLLTYQWQQQAGTGAPWTNLTNGPDITGANSSSVTLNNVTAALNGYNYRVVISGGCTAVDFSDVVSLTVTPKVIDVNPVSYSTCSPIPAGSPVLLAITTSAGGSISTTTTYPSGPINLAVPDLGDAVGVTTSVTVPPLPAGAVITGASVTLNATHTYAGDLIIALKAPNGQVLSLDYAMNATGGPGATTTGLVNTVISSTGTLTLDLGTEPWTGVFAPDAYTTVQAGFPPAAASALIASGIPTASSFSDLYSIPDGTWTLGVYDYAQPDAGTLNDWTLTLTYAVPSSALLQGVWSPQTGLFLDAAGTIPYAGTEEDSVYAAPTASTSYTVTVNTGACPSDPVVIPVTIGTPPGAFTQQPQDVTACEGETVSFTGDVAAGSQVVYQWQVSTDGGATFTDISGATTNTLTLTPISGSDNGNQYQLVVTSASCPDFVVSNPVTLTVNSLPTVTVTAAPYTSLYPGLSTQLTAIVTPAATSQTTYQWYYNGEAIPGATSATFEVNFGTTGNGDFSVRVSNPDLCAAFASADIIISDSATSQLYIWPNPSAGQFQVRFNDGGVNDIRSGAPYLQVYDSKGSRLFRQTFTQLTPYQKMDIDMSRQPKGTYIVVLYDNSGKLIQTGRVVIR